MRINEKAALTEIAKKMAQDPLLSLTFGLRHGYETELEFRDMYKKMLNRIESLPDSTKNDIRDEYIAILVFHLCEFYLRFLKKQQEEIYPIITECLAVYYSDNKILTKKEFEEPLLSGEIPKVLSDWEGGLEHFINFGFERVFTYLKAIPGNATSENLKNAFHRLNENIIQTRLNKIFDGLEDLEIKEWKHYLQAHLDGFPRYITNFFSINPIE